MAMFLHITLLISCAFAAASACEDGDLEIVKGTRCRRYAECENGSWHLKECRFGQIFDPTTTKCAPVTKAGACHDTSKCTEGRSYAYLGNDNVYYRCINGRITVQVCGVGEIFDPELQECRMDEAFQHEALNRAKRSTYRACKEGSKRRDGKTCKDYIECVNGQEVKKSCADCMNFDDTTLSCRFVFVTPCPYTPTPAPPTTTTTPEPTTQETTTTPEPTTQETTTTPEPTTQETTTTPEPTTQETTTTPEPTTQETTTTPEPTTETTTTPVPTTSTEAPCKEGDKVGLVDPECKAYKECKKGVWVKDACGWWRKFDAVKKECEYSWLHKITCAS